MEIVMDLHLHSKYSRAVSKKMDLPHMYLWGKKKGIDLLSVGDFTHPEWYVTLQRQLQEVGEGIYDLRDSFEIKDEFKEFFKDGRSPHFMLTTEISLIYSQDERVHRVHLLVLAPNLSVVGKIIKKLLAQDFNLKSDGRPTFGISCIELSELLFSIDQRIEIIPAHVWTPWFSTYGSKSGFDSIDEAFGEYSEKIFAVETGLSSDPLMNWRIPELDRRSVVSFGDAHSFYKMGREATVLRLKKGEKKGETTYSNIVEGLKQKGVGPFEISHTMEFYPEEGKYHFTGHRTCKVIQSPDETSEKGTICPVCREELTVGVMHRVEALAKRNIEVVEDRDKYGVVWQKDRARARPSFVSVVPLQEIISEVVEKGVNTKMVLSLYDLLVSRLGSEFEVLLRTPIEKIESVGGRRMAEAISRVRGRNIDIDPGYDGVFGKVRVWEEKEEKMNPQMGFEF